VATIAFLGTGLMGAPMAARLCDAGHRVVAWNRTVAKLEPLRRVGVLTAATPADAIDSADFICLMLTDAAAANAVLFGAHGVAAAGRPAQLLIDFSTLGPAATHSLAEKLRAQCGMRWVDCPVSGGVNGATAGRLVAFCGGDEQDVTRARAVLGPLMARVNYLGPLGAGQALKLCNQIIVATNLVAIAEALSLASAFGLDRRQLPEALSGGFADSQPLQIFGPRMAAGVTTPKLGELALMLKDVEAAVATASAAGSPSPLTRQVMAMYRQASELRLDNDDVGALMRLYERRE
jgi:3-hydroxyisobutyrate dehydrogenase-like beta-hydroxyacid dehydrogenase